MGLQWREDEKRNRLHCFATQEAEPVAPGNVALCGWVFEGTISAGLISVAEWRAVQGDRAICHDCNIQWALRSPRT